jgi:hypothetical protein
VAGDRRPSQRRSRSCQLASRQSSVVSRQSSQHCRGFDRGHALAVRKLRSSAAGTFGFPEEEDLVRVDSTDRPGVSAGLVVTLVVSHAQLLVALAVRDWPGAVDDVHPIVVADLHRTGDVGVDVSRVSAPGTVRPVKSHADSHNGSGDGGARDQSSPRWQGLDHQALAQCPIAPECQMPTVWWPPSGRPDVASARRADRQGSGTEVGCHDGSCAAPLCRRQVRHVAGPALSAGERVTGIEPALSAWEADVLPLNYTRVVNR